MIIVTGAAGFIGSCLISRLNKENFNAIVAVDKFDDPDKNKNLVGKRILHKIERDTFLSWFDDNFEEIEFIFHFGA
ncbi:MAG: NAD-dependent epimerase/dehydratase family protein, partial [Cyclobacteriaceae bacterium]|nr:NAD-dependent epimerase/dehydratase family protein [Cyclobacteriaceae bacterium]